MGLKSSLLYIGSAASEAVWVDRFFLSAMMVWRAVILFHWSPRVHLLDLHPSFLSSLAAPSLHPDTLTRVETLFKSTAAHMHECAHKQTAHMHISRQLRFTCLRVEVMAGQRSRSASLASSVMALLSSDVSLYISGWRRGMKKRPAVSLQLLFSFTSAQK